MRIAGIETCSFCNGEGARYVVFTQGCAHRCPECQNPDTWDFTDGQLMPVQQIACDFKAHRYVDGITLSGGDPYYQWKECCALLDLLPGVNIWCYTGFEWDEIKDNPLTKRLDTVVTGPFVKELRCYDRMYGSSNQEIHHPKEELK